MKLILFAKSMLVLGMLSLLAFIAMPMDLLTLAKLLAAAIVISVIFSIAYPELRGLKKGDTVMVLASDSPYSLLGRFGTAAQDGKKNSTVKIKLGDGNEVTGLVESYEGLITPPRVRVMYEERLVEQ
ncbi:MAG: hypothetical protein V1492_03765 [Candidatus Micrarchaeota archaeon]